MSPLANIASYSQHVHSVHERFPFIASSTLRVVPMGATLARVEGRVECSGGVALEVWELVDFNEHRLRSYSYEVFLRSEKFCWYDHWPHPELPELAATFPHHRHLPPNLRDNRLPASGIGFDHPNLDVVLADIARDFLPPPNPPSPHP
jgi:hypothetical protein